MNSKQNHLRFSRSVALVLLISAGPALAEESWGIWYGETRHDNSPPPRFEPWRPSSRPVPLQPSWGAQYRWGAIPPPPPYGFVPPPPYGPPPGYRPGPWFPGYFQGPPPRPPGHHHGHHGGHHDERGRGEPPRGGWGMRERHH